MSINYIFIKKLYKFLITKSSFRDYFFIFTISGIILLVKFHYLFTANAILPGWDTLGHYYALLKSVLLLQEGELRGYMLNWFGGMPIFYFYPALAFWLMSLVSLIFPHLSLALILKGFLFLSLASVPVVFHFFVRSFFPKEKISFLISLLLGLAYIFYQPFEFGSTGIGIAGAIPVGLFITPLATSLVLIFLVYFKKLITDTKKKIFSINFFWTLIFGTLIVYTHILSMIFAAFFAAIIFLFYFKRDSIKRVLILFVSLILTGAYALYPLFAYFGFSSGWRVDTSSYFHDPLLLILAFDLSGLLRGDFINFNWLWFFIFIFFIIGLIRLFRQKCFLLPLLFFIPFIIVPRDFISQIFPALPIHYYRIMPLIFFMYLSIGAFGVHEFLKYRSGSVGKICKYFIVSILFVALLWQIVSFNFLNSSMNIKPRLIDSYVNPIQYYNNLQDYPLENSARNTMKYFSDQKISSRVVPELNGRDAMINLGSAHYFDTLLPMVNNTPTIFGLYAESAYQVPFVFIPLQILSGNRFAYGNTISLMADEKYLEESPESVIKELALFNTEYLISGSNYFEESLGQASSSVERINLDKNISPFGIYRVKEETRDFISSPKYLPALYINQDNNLSFRDFALGWYKMIDVLDFPVIFDGQKIKDINYNNLDKISFLIVHSDNLSLKDIKELQLLGKKLVVLSQEKYRGATLPEDFILIEDFRPGVNYYGEDLLQVVNYTTLNNLEDVFRENRLEAINSQFINQTSLEASVWEDEKIVFSGEGPIIVNASYFPNWRSINGEQEVYQVAPGQMLVFAEGETNLSFSPGIGEKVSAWLSAISIITLIILGLFFWRRKK